MIWSILMHRSTQEDSKEIYFVFLNFLKIYANFGSLDEFQEYLNQYMEMKRIPGHSGPNMAPECGPYRAIGHQVRMGCCA
jgi:hypothetical protein